MISVSQNVYIDKLDGIVNKHNNTYHSIIKMKPIDVKSSTYIDSSKEIKEIHDKDPKFKIGDFVRISKYKNIFAEGYVPNWSEELFVIKKVQNTVPWTYVISDLKGQEITGKFYEKEFQKKNQKEFRVEKVIKRKEDKLYVQCKCHDSSFNSWINRKEDKLYVQCKCHDSSFNSWINKKRHNINELIFSRTKIFRRKSES